MSAQNSSQQMLSERQQGRKGEDQFEIIHDNNNNNNEFIDY